MIAAEIYRRTVRPIAVAAAVWVALAAAAQPSQLELNKRIATEFYDAAINRKDFAAASQYLGSHYRQHNPTAADGAEGLRAFIDFLEDALSEPARRDQACHRRRRSRGVARALDARRRLPPGARSSTSSDVENGKIVEHWDVIQDIPAQPANANGMF